MSDLRVLAALADGFGVDLGFRTAAGARAELEELGVWEGDRAPAPDFEPGRASRPDDGQAVLATWRLSLDDSRALDGEPFLRATIRPPVARVGPRSAGKTRLGGDDLDRSRFAALSRGRRTRPWSRASSGCRAERRRSGSAQCLAAAAGDVVTLEPLELEVAP